MIVVADSSPLIALSICNSLTLLEALFGEVVVPEAVFEEICIPGKPLLKILEASDIHLSQDLIQD
ncbi:MAG: DUF3368 domain-containing protein, partial [Pseudomonadota bacterium]